MAYNAVLNASVLAYGAAAQCRAISIDVRPERVLAKAVRIRVDDEY